jgi:hypothetical protein
VHSTFFLQSHAFVTKARRHWVILDVNRDKYLCVDRGQFESLGPWIHGWEELAGEPERSAAPAGDEAIADEAIALARELLRLGILSQSVNNAKVARPIAYPLPTEALDVEAFAPSRRSSCIHAPAFFLSAARASRQLREHSFQSVVSAVGARKHRNQSPRNPLDSGRIRSLTAVFASLRLFYPRAYLCLFDSLALLNFLARADLYPDWVFGVRAEPFEAHCWLQSGKVVLNDTLERVSAFTPIMCV